jgi:predicted O-methyltransferase YrrM
LTDWRTVHGWLTEAEGDKLAELAADKEVVELGAWKGRSTLAMARTARHVDSYDTFAGDADTGPADTLAEFQANVGDAANVEVNVHDFSDGLVTLYPPGIIDMVFVDGQHDEASAHRDALTAKRLLKPGGVVAFHDFNYVSVVTAAFKAGFVCEGVVDSLGWGRFA